ncbi:MAG: hypothetical protein M1840_007738 [Geoglossum simile]|nr:MAG: hypothetical protein M1840_007738 [Geoglossum simile]
MDGEVVSHLITNLPSSWRIIWTIISNQPAASKTLNYTINALVNYEIELQDDEKAEQPHTNALTATRGNQRTSEQSRYRDRGGIKKISQQEHIRCWYCLRSGHKKSACYTGIRAEEEEKKRISDKHIEAGMALVEPF